MLTRAAVDGSCMRLTGDLLLSSRRLLAMPGQGQDGLAAKSQLQASGAKRRRTENSAAAGSGSARLREKASACALAKLKAARQVAARPHLTLIALAHSAGLHVQAC